MSDKIDYKSTEQAHWRIDEVTSAVGELTQTVKKHDEELGSIRATHRGVTIAAFTVVVVIAASEMGLFVVIKRFIGL